MSEVQKPVLEQAEAGSVEKASKPIATGFVPGGLGVDGYQLRIRKDLLDNPDRIANFDITLPGGLTARFIRSGSWARTGEAERIGRHPY